MTFSPALLIALCGLSFGLIGRQAFAIATQTPPSPATHTPTVRHVMVALNNEFTETNLAVANTILETVRQTVSAEEPIFLSKGLQRIVVRPLIAQENFVEILGYNQKNQLIGSFLLREKFALNVPSVRHALSNMCWPQENLRAQSLGKLIISQNDVRGTRAYLNGYPLKNSLKQNDVTFDLDVPVGADSDRNVLMVTGPNRPIVGRVLGKAMLFKTHRWAIPPQRFARR